MLKIDRLKAQIKEADCILDSKDITHAQEFQDLMVATYSSEIPFLAQKLSTYQYGASEDYLNDTRILKEILLNYQANIKLYPVKRTRERVAFKPTSPVYGR